VRNAIIRFYEWYDSLEDTRRFLYFMGFLFLFVMLIPAGLSVSLHFEARASGLLISLAGFVPILILGGTRIWYIERCYRPRSSRKRQHGA